MGALTAFVITVSDGVVAGTREDRSGAAAEGIVEAMGFRVERRVIPDGAVGVAEALREAAASDAALVVTTGGTGFTERDQTPEGTLAAIEREAPGLAEAMRAATFGENPHGMLSRGVCGIVGRTLVVNLPGSPSGVEESLGVISDALPHAVALLRGDPTDH